MSYLGVATPSAASKQLQNYKLRTSLWKPSLSTSAPTPPSPQQLDVLINNAGIVLDDKHQSREKTLRDTMLETYNTNVFGAMVALETFAPLLEKSPVPRVLFMSRNLGSFGRNFLDGLQHPIYRSSKTTLNMLCWTYAQMYRDRGWKINACCPVYAATNLNAFVGGGTVESGAINAVRLATLGVDGETGMYSNEGLIPW